MGLEHSVTLTGLYRHHKGGHYRVFVSDVVNEATKEHGVVGAWAIDAEHPIGTPVSWFPLHGEHGFAAMIEAKERHHVPVFERIAD